MLYRCLTIAMLLLFAFSPTYILAIPQLLAIDPDPTLDSQGVLVICLMLLVLVALLMEYAPPDLVLFFGGITFCLTNIISFEEFLQGFSTPTLLTLAMLFVFMRCLESNGIMDWVAAKMFSSSSTKRPIQLLQICTPIVMLSTCFSNTALALFYTPLVRRWALERNLFPSEFLIPIAFCSILGGNMTLIGSSSNLVVEALLEDLDPQAAFGFFSILPLGGLVAFAGLGFLICLGYKLMPQRKVADDPFRPSYSLVLELRASQECLLIGYSLSELYTSYLRNISVLEIKRKTRAIDSPNQQERVRSGDTLVLFGDVARLLELKRMPGLLFVQDSSHNVAFSSTHFAEAVLSSASELIGKTLRELEFRQNFSARVVAIYREGKRLEGDLAQYSLKAGDVLFLLSREALAEKESVQRNFFLIRQASAQMPVSPIRAALSTGILGFMVLIAYAAESIVYASCFAVLLILAMKLIEIRHLRKSIHWDLLVLLGSGMAYGKVLTVSGVAAWLAYQLHEIVGHNPYAIIATVFITTTLMSQIINPSACALMMFPIATTLTYLGGYEGPVTLQAIGATLTIAASCCFLSPIGYQTNMIIYGPGGYKFSDFARVGLPLTIIVGVICVLFVPWWWPFQSS